MKTRFVDYLWDDAKANALDPVERLIYRSNLLGSDQRITNTGGGNTSAKLQQTDPLTGEKVEVLWVKGSGGDLRTEVWNGCVRCTKHPRIRGLRRTWKTRWWPLIRTARST
jgi:rhamnose utilization protein RhaD (predicted bifunctional aldolase and dehydrogenase)